MNEQVEIINFGKETPIQLKTMYLEQLDSHWHKGIEILLVLSGEVTITCGGFNYEMKEDDLIVVNEYSIHGLKSRTGCNLVSLQVDTQKIARGENLYFVCNSAADHDKGRYYILKRLIAELVKTNSSFNKNNVYLNHSILYHIMYELSSNFSGDRNNSNSQKYFDRLNSIITYIDEHYRENITLTDLADHLHLSVPYLSAFFDKQLGVNFLTYYNRLRFEHAVNELLSTDMSVEEVSLNNGFPDPRSFVNLFKKRYNCLPSVYRKNASTNAEAISAARAIQLEKAESSLLILEKYLPEPTAQQREDTVALAPDKIINREGISIASPATPLKHTFKTFVVVDRAKDILFAETQQRLSEIQKVIGYEYIQFHGMLSDDMHVYEEDALGNPTYSFNNIDKVIDFLLSIRLKPLIEFSFMPKALARHPERTTYATPVVISPPKDYNKWKDLIYFLTKHLAEKYSVPEVKSWLFTVWHEAATTTKLFGFDDDNDLYLLYKTAYEGVKSVNKSFVFGSPSIWLLYENNRLWLRNFINYCNDNNCSPEFMNLHFFDNDYQGGENLDYNPTTTAHDRLNTDEDSFQKYIEKTKTIFDELNLGNLPIYLTEWNLTASNKNLLNDTCFKSCYLTKNLLENYDKLSSFGYRLLSDTIEDTQPPTEQFHGGFGLYTTNGIKKPHYYAFEFINKLGSKMIEKGRGYFITRSHRQVQIILYNYEHFNHLFATGKKFDVTYTKRYTAFSELGKMSATLELSDIPAKSCKIKEHILNQKYGSAFDEWVRMGAPKLDSDSIDYLKQICVPKLVVREQTFEGGKLLITAALAPLEVRLIQIEY